MGAILCRQAYPGATITPLMLAMLSLATAADTVTVPGGQVTLGSGRASDEPLRTVTLSEFRLDRAEVTIAAYERFVASAAQERGHWSDAGWAWRQSGGGASPEERSAGRDPNHPVVAVTWYEADAYCRWAGGALPTEAQWERAACGGQQQRFPWGDEEEVSASWYAGGKFGHIVDVNTQPASSQDAALHSPDGALHMAGNVWEWTADWYHREGNNESGLTDPTGPDDGTWRTLRGGSFMNLPSYCTCTHREPARPQRVAFTTGFRCAYPSP